MPADAQLERELEAIDAALEGRPVPADLTDWAELALLLRDERPEVDPAFARELDTRVQSRFPRESRGKLWLSSLMAKSFAVPAVAASMLIALVVGVSLIPKGTDETDPGGAGSTGSTVLEDADSGAGEAAAPQAEGAGGGGSDELRRDSAGPTAASGESAGAPEPALSVPPVPGGGSPRSDSRATRKVETSASITLTTKPDDVQKVANEIVQVTDTFGGFVVVSSVTTSDGGGGGTFELRVPSSRLKQALAELSRLANVTERREATQDITQQSVSARDRLADARADRRGLLRRLERADTDAERDALRAQLREVGRRIAAAKADVARVDNRARFSTIAVSLVADPAAAEAEDDGVWSPGDAADDAWRVLQVIAGVALIALAILVPLGLLVALLWLAGRIAAHRRRERLLDAV